MNDRTTGRIHSYYEAAGVAMELIEKEGLHPTAFYDEIPAGGKKTYMLNYKGSNLLAGLMGVHITELTETDESDETEVVVKATAQNPAGDKGWAWLSRPKQKGKGSDEDDWREKIYTHAKRNALRDLIPYGIFLEMLVRKATMNAQQAKQQPAQQQQKAQPKQQQAVKTPLEAAQALAKQTWIAEEESLKNLHGIKGKDVLEFAENKFGKKQDKWSASDFNRFTVMLKDPVKSGVPTAYEDETPEQNAKDALEESGEDLMSAEELAENAPEEDADDTAEENSENSEEELGQIMMELNGAETQEGASS